MPRPLWNVVFCGFVYMALHLVFLPITNPFLYIKFIPAIVGLVIIFIAVRGLTKEQKIWYEKLVAELIDDFQMALIIGYSLYLIYFMIVSHCTDIEALGLVIASLIITGPDYIFLTQFYKMVDEVVYFAPLRLSYLPFGYVPMNLCQTNSVPPQSYVGYYPVMNGQVPMASYPNINL